MTREHPRRQREGEPGEDAGEVGAHSERAGDLGRAREGDAQDQRHPEPLDHPAGEVEQEAQREERAHRPQVAVRLVLQLAEGALAVPQVRRPGQEVEGRDREVELGVRDEQARATGSWPGRSAARRRRAAATGTASRPGSLLPQHEHEVPRHHLSHHRHTEQPAAPPGVVARQEVHDLGVLLGAGPAQAVGDGDGEQRLAVPVLGLVAVPRGVPASRPAPAEEVPRRRSRGRPTGRTRWCS